MYRIGWILHKEWERVSRRRRVVEEFLVLVLVLDCVCLLRLADGEKEEEEQVLPLPFSWTTEGG